jgi:hypothetical protein
MNAWIKKRTAALLIGIIIVVFMVAKLLRDGLLHMYGA